MVRSRVLLSAIVAALAVALAGCDATVYPGYAYGGYGYPWGGYPIYYGGTSYFGGYWAPGRTSYGGGVYRRAGGYHGRYRGGYRVH